MQLGDKVRDTVTGFEGVAIGRTEWLNGCVRFCLQSQTLKDGIPTEAQTFDEGQLRLVKVGEVVVERLVRLGDESAAKTRQATGGPMPTPRRQADPSR